MDINRYSWILNDILFGFVDFAASFCPSSWAIYTTRPGNHPKQLNWNITMLFMGK